MTSHLAPQNWGNEKEGVVFSFFIATFLFSISLIVRYYWSYDIELNGDAVHKWLIIRKAVENNTLPIISDHHGIRWAINFPVYFIQLIFGTNPKVYYYWPMFSASISVLFSYLIFKKMFNWKMGVLVGVFTIIYSQAIRQGSQFLPMGSATMYFQIFIFCLLLWVEKKKLFYLLLSSLFFFLSYGTKITALYYLPAVLFVLVYFGRNNKVLSFRPLLMWLLAFSVFFGFETVIINKTLNTNYGRIEVIVMNHGPYAQKSHQKKTAKQRPAVVKLNESWVTKSNSLLQYSVNFAAIAWLYKDKPYFYTPIYLALLLTMFFWWRGTSYFKILSLIFLFGFIGHSYGVFQFYPFLRTERLYIRYLTLQSLLSWYVIFISIGALTATIKYKRFSINHISLGILGLFVFVHFYSLVTTGIRKLPKVPGIVSTAATHNTIKEAIRKNHELFLKCSDKPLRPCSDKWVYYYSKLHKLPYLRKPKRKTLRLRNNVSYSQINRVDPKTSEAKKVFISLRR